MSCCEVYICKVGSEVLYVGQGRVGRSTHCTSGVSHVYGLNRLYFLGYNLEVEVLWTNIAPEEARAKESELIAQHNPKFNYIGNRGSNTKVYNYHYLPSAERSFNPQNMTAINHWFRVRKDDRGHYKVCREVSSDYYQHIFDKMDEKKFSAMRDVNIFIHEELMFGGYDGKTSKGTPTSKISCDLLMNCGIMVVDIST